MYREDMTKLANVGVKPPGGTLASSNLAILKVLELAGAPARGIRLADRTESDNPR